MKTKLATSLVISALLVPAAGYAAEKTVTQSVKETVADSVITTKIKTEYAKDKLVDMLDITVETDDKGVVTLSGTAKSKAQADQAAKIARETKGVTSVKNNLKIAAVPAKQSTASSVKEAVADSVITTKIKAEYAKDKLVDMLDISVETDDKGAVTLGGMAKTKAESDQAVKIARETKGVMSVRNNIKVSAN
jgi:hyperosmotically inducible protein